MSIFRNVILNLKTEQDCDRVIGLYKEQLSSLENEGLEGFTFVDYQRSQFCSF